MNAEQKLTLLFSWSMLLAWLYWISCANPPTDALMNFLFTHGAR